MPDLAVEVVSKNNPIYEVEQKIAHYRQVGVELVWVICPFSKTVQVYRLATGLTQEIYDLSRELTGEAVVPGFKLAVSKLF